MAEQFFENISAFFTNIFSLSKHIYQLAVLETKLSIKSLVILFLLLILMIILFCSIWVCLSVAIALWLVTFGLSTPLAFASLALINFILALIIVPLMNYYKNNMKFVATRRQLRVRNN